MSELNQRFGHQHHFEGPTVTTVAGAVGIEFKCDCGYLFQAANEYTEEYWRPRTESYWREKIAGEVLEYFAHKDRPMDCVEQIANGTDYCTDIEEVADLIVHPFAIAIARGKR